MKAFSALSEQEILALAISLEEEHGRIYADYADGLKETFPSSAKVFTEMAEEENIHRRWLIDLYVSKFGSHIPLIRRQDVKGFVKHEPLWMVRPLGLDKVREQAEAIEYETRLFYERSMERVSDANIRKLLGDLAAAEREHVSLAQKLGAEHLTKDAKAEEEEARHRMFVLQVVQPGLAGLMDGSVSTLAPLFAAAMATQNTWETFLVGTAASVGAGISMGMAEAMSDDGSLTGRGQPWLRGTITGLMTAIGGIGHTLPYLIPNFKVATTVAVIVVLVELWVIAWIRARYMDTKFLRAAFEVVVGGLIVFAAGMLIGSA
ncbi:MAG: VIT1/CCC1 transporter family protein [Hyphomicrobiales bacterium]|nr:VIT1/CCC1 transporter family protein [Hyphomicrobiales bacterium]